MHKVIMQSSRGVRVFIIIRVAGSELAQHLLLVLPCSFIAGVAGGVLGGWV
jgi:hypothetical protein